VQRGHITKVPDGCEVVRYTMRPAGVPYCSILTPRHVRCKNASQRAAGVRAWSFYFEGPPYPPGTRSLTLDAIRRCAQPNKVRTRSRIVTRVDPAVHTTVLTVHTTVRSHVDRDARHAGGRPFDAAIPSRGERALS
jgi:hypothetical protein